MAGYNPNCFQCRYLNAEGRFAICSMHGNSIPHVGMEFVCADFSDQKNGKGIKDYKGSKLSEKISADGLFYYYSEKYVFLLDAFERLGNPIVSGFAPVGVFTDSLESGITIAPDKTLFLHRIPFAEFINPLIVTTPVGEVEGDIQGPNKNGEYQLKIDAKSLSGSFQHWFYIERLTEELHQSPQFQKALSGGVPLFVEIVSNNRLKLRPNEVFMRELFGDAGMARFGDT